jgi:thiol-disulfide isomerase/thioredoxin
MYFLSSNINSLSFDELKSQYQKLGDTFKNSQYAKTISGKIDRMEATAVGKEAIPINKVDINNNPVSLETLRGKYVLVDFWGSWCHPCRASHPHLKELYSKYKDDGFEILGVAYEQGKTLEDCKTRWKNAIKEDDLTWLQVLNNDGAKEFDVVNAYGVTAFPTKILLDKEGKILARYVGSGEDIDKKLEEIFGK